MKHIFTISLCFLALSLSAQAPVVGDYYGGGVVFYLDGNGGGLIASTNNVGATFSGGNVAWGCQGWFETSTSLGTGLSNTILIVNGCNSYPIAAKICNDYTVTENGITYDDWYLPSRDELHQIYLNIGLNGYTGGTSFWSSSEFSSSQAWMDYFSGLGQNAEHKAINNTHDSRAIRSFSLPMLGCTDPTASNFDPEANEDDGSCIYTGCLDSSACNFNENATEDDGSCDYSCCPGPGCCNDGTIWDEETQTCLFDESFCAWQPDGNADGLIGVEDLLDLLAVYGDTDLDSDGVWDSIDDCLDLEACNYDANPTEPCGFIDALGECGGGCEGDTDGDDICDDIDGCIGVVDECGVCNGPGATEVVIESITLLYDSVYAEAIDNWFVFEVGADTVFNYVCDPVFVACGDLVSHEGYHYSTVQIGDQCWFSENCRYLPVVSPSSEGSESDPYYYVYDYQGSDVTAAQATTNYATYGVLYNWPAVMTAGICPSGWHIPNDLVWQTMEMTLGMSEADASSEGLRGIDEGYQMKSTSGWNNGGNGSNSSGFTGLPGGYRFMNFLDFGGFFYDNGGYGFWWSASESGSYSWVRKLNANYDNVDRSVVDRSNGFSARCVIDYTDECGVLNGDNSTCSDECGVPYGDNSTCVGCDGVPNSGLVYDECEVCGGDNSTCLDDCGILNGDNSTCFTSCGDDISHEGYDYSTVQIADQCWFSENCRYLPVVSSSSAGSDTSPYYYVYGYEGSTVAEAKATSNYDTYGVLYNWPAVMTEGICPSGWHIPSDGEFAELSDFLGGEDVAGGKMKEAGYDHWYSPNEGATNSSGWTGLPGGYRYSGGFNGIGYYGYWWSASESGSYSWLRELGYGSDTVIRFSSSRDYGDSARCVRD